MANNQYVNKVEYGGNTVVDLTSDTTTANDVVAGQNFHLASGAPATGTIPNLDTMTFGNLSNPPSRGYTDGAFYEMLAEAINTKKAQGGGSGGIDPSDATASAGDILDGKSAYIASGKVNGTMPAKSATDVTASGADVTVPAGYYGTEVTKSVPAGSASTPATSITANPTIAVDSATGKITASVSASQDVAPNVTAGYVSGGTAGTVSVSGSATESLPTQGAQAITPTTTAQTIVAGKFLTGAQTIEGDANLVAENIKKGTSIFGVEGTYSGVALEIVATAPTGSTVTAEKDGSTYTGVENPSGTYTIQVPEYGTYTVAATLNGDTTANSVTIAREQTILKYINPTNYLRFSSKNPFTISVNNAKKNWDGILYWRNGSTGWAEWDGAQKLSSANGTLDLCGAGNTHITGLYMSDNARFNITGSEVQCNGNIETLLDWQTVDNGQHPAMGSSAYESLFSGCTALTSAPELPAVDLSASCYTQMFMDCSSLTSAPALPAMRLTSECYASMFNYCTSLTSAPSLSATTLAEGCYAFMFKGCTRITSAPALPATTLADTCYLKMFEGCTALVRLPALPARALPESCYDEMFADCASIKLSNTKTGAYQYAFRIPSAGSGSVGTDSIRNMFFETGGTFTGTPEINTTYYTTNQPVS